MSGTPRKFKDTPIGPVQVLKGQTPWFPIWVCFLRGLPNWFSFRLVPFVQLPNIAKAKAKAKGKAKSAAGAKSKPKAKAKAKAKTGHQQRTVNKPLSQSLLWMDEFLHHLRNPGMMIPLQIPIKNGFPWIQSGAKRISSIHSIIEVMGASQNGGAPLVCQWKPNDPGGLGAEKMENHPSIQPV